MYYRPHSQGENVTSSVNGGDVGLGCIASAMEDIPKIQRLKHED